MAPHRDATPIYDKAVQYLAKGYAVACIPILDPYGDPAVYAITEHVEASPEILAAGLSPDRRDRLALCLGMIFAAHIDAKAEGLNPIS